jgi:hypothetical protein
MMITQSKLEDAVTGQLNILSDRLPSKGEQLKVALPVNIRRKGPNREAENSGPDGNGNGVEVGKWGNLLMLPRLLPAMKLEREVPNRNRTYIRLVDIPRNEKISAMVSPMNVDSSTPTVDATHPHLNPVRD